MRFATERQPVRRATRSAAAANDSIPSVPECAMSDALWLSSWIARSDLSPPPKPAQE